MGEQISNLSKVRKFPTYGGDRNDTNYYFIYKLHKRDIGRYINTWFSGRTMYASDLDKFKVKFKRNEMSDYLIKDERWIVKRVDEVTSRRLYLRDINPIQLTILCPTGYDGKIETPYHMLCSVCSVDDSSFTIWFMSKPINELENIRVKLMRWINTRPIINGDEFINKCLELGADLSQVHYD